MFLVKKITHINYAYSLIVLSLAWALCFTIIDANALFKGIAESQHTPLPNYNNTPDQQIIKPLPDFTKFRDIKQKKETFFSYLLPLVEEENNHILKLRTALYDLQQKITSKQITSLSSDEISWVQGLSAQYKCEPQKQLIETIEELLIKINTIPPSLVLAQAAIESGWGTSRFATAGNNLFGQWCFKKGCGIVPQNRPEDKSHEVADFDNVNSSIRSYIKNLNSFSAYTQFRSLRQQLHKNSGIYSNSLLLVPGLSNYSEQGEQYLSKIRSVIKVNNLTRFDLGV